MYPTKYVLWGWGGISLFYILLKVNPASSLLPLGHLEISSRSVPPSNPLFQKTVKSVINHVNITRVEEFVKHFTSFHNRHCTSETGRSSQLWLLSQVEGSVKKYVGKAVLREVDHLGYLQKSVVARVEGVDPKLKREVVILGAHLDSINKQGSKLRAPGADDNASGAAAVLETFRAIVGTAGPFLKRTVEFQWYGAEELGLRGSRPIAQDYKRRNVNVVGMLNMDAVGYHTEGIDDIGVVINNGDPKLYQLLHVLADEYLSFGSRNRTYRRTSTSDHDSWTKAGFSAVTTAAVNDHPQMHTELDTIESIHFGQIKEFVKLAIAFVIEMAEVI